MPSEAAPPFSTTVASVLLDAVRAAAALLVCLSHARNLLFLDYPQLTAHRKLLFLPYLICHTGHQAVVVFFVLSGYLVGGHILRALRNGTWSWRVYLLQRGVRLWAVLLPALLLGGLLDLAALHLHLAPRLYAGLIPNHLTYAVRPQLTWTAFAGNALFLQTICTPVFGSNGALWSLANEFWYYLLFPLALLALRSRYPLPIRLALGIASIAIVAFVGRGILLLFPSWLLGVLLAISPIRRTATATRWLALALYCPFFFVLPRLNFAADLLPDYLLALATFALLRALLGAQHPSPAQSWYVHLCRYAAGCSYTLYLVHTPLLLLLTALCIRDEGDARWTPDPLHLAAGCALFAATLLYACAVAQITERRTPALRDWLVRLLHIEQAVHYL